MPKTSTSPKKTVFLGAAPTPEHTRGNADAIEVHGERFLSRYGRDLTRDEIRLVQGYRGLTRDQQKQIREGVSGLLIQNASAADELRAARSMAREAGRDARQLPGGGR